ncbi:MAG: hypothetical protein JSR21_04720 [Proteobacteria bacterium]|nr:hypothetical protein [Pseudomonadota bacterium]
MRIGLLALAGVLVLLAAAAAPRAEGAGSPLPATHAVAPGKGRYTGLPVPRFVSLRSDRVNLRRGPGLRYPIDWVVQRRGLPVEIEREFHNWRLIRLPDGTRGWVFHALLSGKRTAVVQRAGQVLRRRPQAQARAVAVVQQGVVCDVSGAQRTPDGWCRVQVQGEGGWLRCAALWAAPAMSPAPAPLPGW